ncbi:hypothetical protein [Paraburkholderia gardini]|nr:hypothetical protein [Paraburkholderia gardini]
MRYADGARAACVKRKKSSRSCSVKVRLQANLNMDPPFDRKPGDAPALDDAEIKDVVAFLNTLTDGYRPAAH